MNSRRLLRISYWVGAIVDFVNAIAMVSPHLMARMLNLDQVPTSVDARLALLMGASLSVWMDSLAHLGGSETR